jgi:hypothetical protein
MRHASIYVAAVSLGALLASPVVGAPIYNNLTPNNQMAIATRPGAPGVFEIEAGDDFVLGTQTLINGGSLVGLIVPTPGAVPTISDVVVEIYRVFPNDSNAARIPNVPTRANSPSDVEFDSRDSGASQLLFTSAVLSATFTALNSVQPGGIHASPNQTTNGNGPITGQEVQFNLTFNAPFNLPADHYFFVPQVAVTGGQFYWLSASRPISGPGTTPFSPDLQAWTRDANLDPDWLRVGTDIVGGGASAPTFNTAFSLDGTAIPEPASVLLVVAGLALIGVGRRIVLTRNS